MTKPTGGNKTPPAAGSTASSPAESPLSIPSLTGAAAAQTTVIVQEGEDAQAIEQTSAAPAASPMANALGGGRALDRPVVRSGAREVNEVATPVQSLDLGQIDKLLEDLRRTDLEIEVQNGHLNMDHAEHLKFNEEHVIINIHETTEVGAEDPVPLRVNGSTVVVKRGVNTIVRRKYAELLMRMKPQQVTTRIDRSDIDNVKNIVEKRSALKYPFHIVRDDNPKSVEWQRKVMSEI